MNNREYYLSLPHDMSGSMSKDRFRMELLWGISKMLDVYDTSDFTMVFDCVYVILETEWYLNKDET